MRKNFRLNASYLSLNLSNKSKYQTQLLQNPFFLEFTEELPTSDMQTLMSLAKIELFPAKKHIVINPSKLYFTFDHSALLTSNIGYQVQGPSSNLIQDFESKYEEFTSDIGLMFRKRIDVLYHRFQLMIESQDEYLYNLSRFLNITVQKSYDIILSQIDSVVAVIDKNKIPESIFEKLRGKCEQRISFLRSFPLLKHLPDFYFHLYLPSFVYRKYFSSAKIPISAKQHVYFLQTGEMEFSKKVDTGDVKIFKIIGQQMFLIVEDIDTVKINTEFVKYFAIVKRSLDKLMAESENWKGYSDIVQGMKQCNTELKEKALKFHEDKTLLSPNGVVSAESEEVSPVIQKSFWNQNIFTKQFNKHITKLDLKKTGVLRKLLARSNANAYLYEYKPVVQGMPDMSGIVSRVKEFKEAEYTRIKEGRKENRLVMTYKELVRAGMEEELKPRGKGRGRGSERVLRAVHNRSLPSIRMATSDLVGTASVFDIFKACK